MDGTVTSPAVFTRIRACIMKDTVSTQYLMHSVTSTTKAWYQALRKLPDSRTIFTSSDHQLTSNRSDCTVCVCVCVGGGGVIHECCFSNNLHTCTKGTQCFSPFCLEALAPNGGIVSVSWEVGYGIWEAWWNSSKFQDLAPVYSHTRLMYDCDDVANERR